MGITYSRRNTPSRWAGKEHFLQSGVEFGAALGSIERVFEPWHQFPALSEYETEIASQIQGRKLPYIRRTFGETVNSYSALKGALKRALELNSKRYNVTFNPFLQRRQATFADCLLAPEEHTYFLALHTQVSAVEFRESKDLGRLISRANPLPSMALQADPYGQLDLLFLLEAPSRNYELKQVVEREIARRFGSAPDSVELLPGALPLAGTRLWHNSGTEMGSVEVWINPKEPRYSLKYLRDAFCDAGNGV
jgi:hypothetical protein